MLEDDIFILLCDADGTMRSSDEPIGVAVRSKEQAQLYKKLGGLGYTHSFDRIKVFDTAKEALTYLYPSGGWDKRGY